MSKVTIRSFEESDLQSLIDLDHSFHTDYVWQVDYKTQENQVDIGFKQVKLPRSMLVEYPSDSAKLSTDFPEHGVMLVAESDEGIVGYAKAQTSKAPLAGWISDLVVMRRLRRQGHGTALIGKAHNWALEQGCKRVVLEMQSKNFPAISLAKKLGFEFSGFSDQYYLNQDIALFFSRRI